MLRFRVKPRARGSQLRVEAERGLAVVAANVVASVRAWVGVLRVDPGPTGSTYPRVGQTPVRTSTTLDDRGAGERAECATAGEIATGLDRARVALALASSWSRHTAAEDADN
jgi:hypothetical protein